MRWNELNDDLCPVARGLSVIGDRWTLLLLRECFAGVRRFEQFQANLGVTRHVLADRLRKLEAHGVLRREAYCERPPRHEYRLTDKGKELHVVMLTLADWANRHEPVESARPFRVLMRETGEPARLALVDAVSGEPITHRNVTVERPSRAGREAESDG